ncbi:Uncharacterised protein [uncultured archaeon]|nr:Uncharacterised protein [uncultured archaeon]
MIFFGMPIFAWIGGLTFLLLVTQIILGVMLAGGKKVLKYHRMNAVAIISLTLIHLVFALLFLWGWYVF